jgi:hypothetical protein
MEFPETIAIGIVPTKIKEYARNEINNEIKI